MTPARVLLAKPGLDGHDRGIKVIGMALRDAGAEVVYLGLRQSAEQILGAAEQENVDVIGISVLSGAHVPLCRRLAEVRRERSLEDIPIIAGGTIPNADVGVLRDLGLADVFPVGTALEDVVAGILRIASSVRETSQ
jgi:methylmalonyl-CoA mutase C-terminal domain/subunit